MRGIKAALAGGLLFAAALPGAAFATPCSSVGTLADYTAPGFSCTLGGGVFSNFVFSSTASGPGAIALTSSDIVMGSEDEGVGNGWVLSFASPTSSGTTTSWLAGAGQELDFTIGFDLSYVVPNDLLLYTQNWLFPGQLSGDGTAGLISTATDVAAGFSSSEGLAACGPQAIGCTNAGAGGFGLSFPPFSQYEFTTQFVIDGGQTGSSGIAGAQIIAGELQYSVPEPSALAILGAGLAALGLFVGFRADRRRRENSPEDPRHA